MISGVPPHPSILALWNHYRSIDPTAPITPPSAEYFCDNQRDADACLQLVLKGPKRATSSARADYEGPGEPLPQAGKLLIVTNWAGEAKALIRTHTVTIRNFGDVPATFAALEGEGDGSLAGWRTAHRAFWSRMADGSSRPVDDDFAVVCEEFDLLLPIR